MPKIPHFILVEGEGGQKAFQQQHRQKKLTHKSALVPPPEAGGDPHSAIITMNSHYKTQGEKAQ